MFMMIKSGAEKRKAVKVYNNSIEKDKRKNALSEIDVSLNFNGNGLGLAVTF